MKHLLYCIVQQDPDEPPPEPGMCVVAAHGLAAVVSRVEETSSAPSVSSVLAFEKVVEAMHARQAVIPLRYGCLMESEAAIIRLLEDHRQEYEALLGRLRGMTEMGIRVLCPARPEFCPRISVVSRRRLPGLPAKSLRFRKQPRSGGGSTGRSDHRLGSPAATRSSAEKSPRRTRDACSRCTF